MGIRDLVREGKTIGDEVVEIQNKKTGEHLGIFVPHQYSKQVRRLIDRETEKKLQRVMRFAGAFSGVFPKDKKAIQKIKSQMG